MRIDISQLKKILKKLKKKDFALFEAVRKKINQIAKLDREAIGHFKNLRAPLDEYKRVHVGSFVLTFKLEGDIIVFGKIKHHDEAYR